MLSLGPLAFAAPWLLVALAALPVLWWLLRVTPPTPRRVAFPAVRLLHDLPVAEETPARTPWWLLLLRTRGRGAADPRPRPAGAGAGRRRRRRRAAPARGGRRLGRRGGLARAHGRRHRRARPRRAGRPRARPCSPPRRARRGKAPRVIGPMPAGDLRTRLAALRPKPWAPDHAAALAALEAWRTANPGPLASLAVSDGVEHTAQGAASGALQSALAAAGKLTRRTLRAAGAPPAAAGRRGRSPAPAGAAGAARRRLRSRGAGAHRRWPGARPRGRAAPGERGIGRGGAGASDRDPEPGRPAGVGGRARRRRRAAAR